MARISIITPSFEQGRFLEENILSVHEQDHPDVEHIIIDGGSTDESIEVIKNHEDKLSFWVSEEDRGQTHAINKGLEKASGDIITWINSDDQLLPGALTKVQEAFDQHAGVGLIYGEVYEDRPGREALRHGGPEGRKDIMGLAGMAFPQPASFFRKELITKHGLPNEDYHYGMDYDLYVRFILNERIMGIKEPLARYRFHDESKSTLGHEEFAREWAIIFSKVLRSIPDAELWLSEMKQLGLYHESDDTFKVSRKLDEAELKDAFYYMLYFQIHFLYEAVETVKVNELTTYVKNSYPEFMQQAGLEATHWRTTYLPKPILKLARRIKR